MIDDDKPQPTPGPTITYEGHADALPYGWWERKPGGRGIVLPKTLGDTRNYVLTLEEMREYYAVLVQQAEDANKHRERLRLTIKALETGRHPSFMSAEPKLYTLCGVLEFAVAQAKSKLALMQFLIKASGRVVAERKALVQPVPNTTEGDTK